MCLFSGMQRDGAKVETYKYTVHVGGHVWGVCCVSCIGGGCVLCVFIV